LPNGFIHIYGTSSPYINTSSLGFLLYSCPETQVICVYWIGTPLAFIYTWIFRGRNTLYKQVPILQRELVWDVVQIYFPREVTMAMVAGGRFIYSLKWITIYP